MRSFLKVSIASIALLTSTVLAESDDVPILNVEPLCHGIAAQAANPTETGGPDLTFKACVTSERAVRNDLAKSWPTFAAADKGHGVRLANTGGESSYSALRASLDTAR